MPERLGVRSVNRHHEQEREVDALRLASELEGGAVTADHAGPVARSHARRLVASQCAFGRLAQSGEPAVNFTSVHSFLTSPARSAAIVSWRAAAPFGPRRNHVTSLSCRRAVHRSGNAEGTGGIHATRFGLEVGETIHGLVDAPCATEGVLESWCKARLRNCRTLCSLSMTGESGTSWRRRMFAIFNGRGIGSGMASSRASLSASPSGSGASCSTAATDALPLRLFLVCCGDRDCRRRYRCGRRRHHRCPDLKQTRRVPSTGDQSSRHQHCAGCWCSQRRHQPHREVLRASRCCSVTRHPPDYTPRGECRATLHGNRY